MISSDELDPLLTQVEAELQQIVHSPHHSLDTYYGMMNYHLGWTDENLDSVTANSGKRLRPILCLLACEAAGGVIDEALPAACAVELIHNFSLVHDDIQDASQFRRGRRAVWDIWGQAHGINVGDGIFVLAHLALHRLGSRGVSATRQLAATLAFDRACMSLCEGQYFDMTFEERIDVNLDQYLWMIRHKTAALLAASTQLGAIIASDDQRLADLYFRFGENLGLAYQVQDDILGVWGDERTTGKSSATDIRHKKKALPAVYALNQTDDLAAASRLAKLYRQQGPLDAPDIRRAIVILEHVGAREYAEEMAQDYYSQAIGNLRDIGPANAAQERLQSLAASLLDREV